MDALSAAARLAKKILKKIGDMMSTIFLIAFYYTVFALFALPYRLINRYLNKRKQTTFVAVRKNYTSLKDFSHEG